MVGDTACPGNDGHNGCDLWSDTFGDGPFVSIPRGVHEAEDVLLAESVGNGCGLLVGVTPCKIVWIGPSSLLLGQPGPVQNNRQPSLDDMLFVEGLATNLISISQLCN